MPEHGLCDEPQARVDIDVLCSAVAAAAEPSPASAAAAPAAAQSAAVATAAVATPASVTTDAAVRAGAAVCVVDQRRRHWSRRLRSHHRAARSALLFDLDPRHVHLGVRGGSRRAGG